MDKRRRINVCVWAWAYEKYATSLVTDAKWDETALLIDLSKSTDHPVLNRFFKENFVPYTAHWIYRHPELLKIDGLVRYLLRRNVSDTGMHRTEVLYMR